MGHFGRIRKSVDDSFKAPIASLTALQDVASSLAVDSSISDVSYIRWWERCAVRSAIRS